MNEAARPSLAPMWIGAVLQTLVAFLTFADDRLPGWMPPLMVVSAFIAIAGCLAASTGARGTGAKLTIAGSLVFVPMGLIAVFGARRVLDDLRGAEFAARKRTP